VGNERGLSLGEENGAGGFNHRESFNTITALGLLGSVYFCGVLSMGQLPSQASQSCTHNVWHFCLSLAG